MKSRGSIVFSSEDVTSVHRTPSRDNNLNFNHPGQLKIDVQPGKSTHRSIISKFDDRSQASSRIPNAGAKKVNDSKIREDDLNWVM